MKGCAGFENKLRRRGYKRLGLGGGAVLLAAVLVVAAFLVLVALLVGLLSGAGLGAHGESSGCEAV